MLTAAVAIVGTLASAALVRTGHRAAAGEQVRRLGPQVRWRLPARVRGWAVGALEDAAIDIEPEAACELWFACLGACALFAGGLSSALVLPVTVVAIVAAPVGLHLARRRARRRFVAAVPGLLEQVAAALRGGASLAEAIDGCAQDVSPLAADLRRVGARAGLGVSLAESLAVWPVERPLPSVRAASGALALAAAVGGRAADAIDGLAVSLRERLGAVAEARSLSAQARLSAIVVGAAPVAYLAFSAVIDPSSVAVLVEGGTGRTCLVLGLVLDAAAVAWMRRIVRDDETG